MFFLFDSLLVNKGASGRMNVTQEKYPKNSKGVISPLLQDIFKLFFYRID